MAFLNKSMLAKMAGEATVGQHPMLDKLEVPRNVKEMHLQGCVLAAVLKDGALSPAKRSAVAALGTSLRLSESEVEECVSIVTDLDSDEAKEQFVSELFIVLAGPVYPKYFMKDFEDLLKENGEVPSEMAEYVDYFGSSLFKKKDWRGEQTPLGPSVTPQKDIGAGEKSIVETSCRFDDLQNLESNPSVGYHINPDRCVGCGSCKEACPADAISDYPFEIDHDKCVGCGACEGACPCEAILCGGDVAQDNRKLLSSPRAAQNYSDSLCQRVRDIIVEQLGVNREQVTSDASFIDDLGADSLSAVELIMAFEEAFDAAIPEEDAEKLTTVGKVIDYLHAKGY